MAATTAPEAAAEPADYPDKPQHNPDVDATPDLPPGNSVAAPVVAPAATAAAAAGLVGAATDDGRHRPRRRRRRRLDEAPTVDATDAADLATTRRSVPDAAQPRSTLPATATRPPTSPTTSSTSTTRPPPSVRTSVHDESGPTPRRSAPKPRGRPTTTMTLTEHLGELRIADHPLRRWPITLGAIIIIAFYDQVLDFLRQPYIDLCDGTRRRVLRRGRRPERHRHAVHPRPARGPRDPPAHRHVRRAASSPCR